MGWFLLYGILLGCQLKHVIVKTHLTFDVNCEYCMFYGFANCKICHCKFVKTTYQTFSILFCILIVLLQEMIQIKN